MMDRAITITITIRARIRIRIFTMPEKIERSTSALMTIIWFSKGSAGEDFIEPGNFVYSIVHKLRDEPTSQSRRTDKDSQQQTIGN